MERPNRPIFVLNSFFNRQWNGRKRLVRDGLSARKRGVYRPFQPTTGPGRIVLLTVPTFGFRVCVCVYVYVYVCVCVCVCVCAVVQTARLVTRRCFWLCCLLPRTAVVCGRLPVGYAVLQRCIRARPM